jgi:hypothetical protein
MSDDFEDFYLATVRNTYATARGAAGGDPTSHTTRRSTPTS